MSAIDAKLHNVAPNLESLTLGISVPEWIEQLSLVYKGGGFGRLRVLDLDSIHNESLEGLGQLVTAVSQIPSRGASLEELTGDLYLIDFLARTDKAAAKAKVLSCAKSVSNGLKQSAFPNLQVRNPFPVRRTRGSPSPDRCHLFRQYHNLPRELAMCGDLSWPKRARGGVASLAVWREAGI